MTTPHFPGSEATRQWDEDQYSPWQNSLWLTLDDVYFAVVGGYAEMRHPSPGFTFDDTRFREWKARVLERWSAEATRDNRTRGFTEADLPECAWLSLYERMLAAEPLRPTEPERFNFGMGSWVGTTVGPGLVVSRVRRPEGVTYGVRVAGEVIQFPEEALGYLNDD